MRGGWKLGRLMGIDVYIHWTFWILLMFYTLSGLSEGGPAAGLMSAAFIATLFACVVAHEYGHALTAAAFGIPTHDITVLPIGGLARLSKMPEKPYQELLIALAGPAVNVVIFALLFLVTVIAQITDSAFDWPRPGINFIGTLMVANLALVVFNLLPAFPMDGGRVLRSLLAMRTTHLRATEIAARVGRWMALLFFVMAIVYGQLGLALISLFVVFAGTAELFEARRRAAARPAWMEWVWSPTEPGSGNDPYAGYNPYAPPRGSGGGFSSGFGAGFGNSPGDNDDIIDATEVREIPPPSRPPGFLPR